jgi:hypothetical protein
MQTERMRQLKGAKEKRRASCGKIIQKIILKSRGSQLFILKQQGFSTQFANLSLSEPF